MAAQTGRSYISGTMTDNIEIPTTNSGFSMMTSSTKVLPNDFHNERLPEIASAGLKHPCFHFRLSVVVAIARGQFLRAGRGRKPHICRWNCHPTCHGSRDISTSGFDSHAATSGCPSMKHLLMYTFFEFGVVENCFFSQ